MDPERVRGRGPRGGGGLAARGARATITPGVADPAAFALAPSAADGWATHRTQAAARLVQLPDGVRLEAGPMGAADRNGLAVWSRASWTGDFRASFETRKLDGNVGAGAESLFLLLYFGVRGDGTPGHPAGMADWPGSTTPYTHAYAEHVRGARLTFYFQAPGAAGEAAPVSAAYFKADGSRNPVPAESRVAFPGVHGVPYGWTVRRVGDVVTVMQNARGTRRVVTIASTAFGRHAAAGSFGLLVSPGRRVQVTDFSVGAP